VPEGPGTSRLDRLRAADAALDAALTEPELARVLEREAGLVAVLARHPGLLSRPHEYRRLLRSQNARVWERLAGDDNEALLIPDVLRAILRHPEMWADLVGPHGDAFLPRIEEGVAEAPWLPAVLSANPAMARFASVSSSLVPLALVASGLESRLTTDDRIVSFAGRVTGAASFLRRLGGTEGVAALLEHDGALIKFFGRNPGAVVAFQTPHLENLRGHADLVGELATGYGMAVSAGHWERLFGTPELLAALSRRDNAVARRLLLSAPEAFAEAIARPGFAERLADGSLEAAFARVE
jgi:hypothetical protein